MVYSAKCHQAVPFLAAIVAYNSSVAAYPTAVFRAPTGDARPFGGLCLSIATPLMTSPRRQTDGELSWTTYPGTTRASLLLGVAPSFQYAPGVLFGGVEVGFDFLTADSFGKSRLKPSFNAKVSLVSEGAYWPWVSVGILEVSTMPEQSLNLGYVALTKTLRIDGRSYGRLTLGLARSFAGAEQRFPANCPARAGNDHACLFSGAFPFAPSSPFAMLAGYESPKLGPVIMAMDHLGGYSNVSVTSFGIKIQLSKDAWVVLTRFYGSEWNPEHLRRIGTTNAEPVTGFILGLASTLDLLAAVRPQAVSAGAR